MLAVDTNVLVRFLTNDDPEQARRARAVLASGPFQISATVLLETEWVLRSFYRFERRAVIEKLAGLAGLPQVRLVEAQSIRMALQWAADGLDFADALHLASADACEAFVTFDERLAKAAPANAVPVLPPPAA